MRATAIWPAVLALMFSVTGHAQTAWQPERQIELVVGSGPGGGNDRTACMLQKILNENKWLN